MRLELEMCRNGNQLFIQVSGRGLNICLCGESEELKKVFVRAYIFLEDEAGQQGSGLFNSQIIKEAVENHLRQQELVTTGEITHTESMIR